jgi:hypothetical protein
MACCTHRDASADSLVVAFVCTEPELVEQNLTKASTEQTGGKVE